MLNNKHLQIKVARLVQLISAAFEHCVACMGKVMLWKMLCFTWQSMGRTNHKFPIYATQNVQTQLKSTVHTTVTHCGELEPRFLGG